jgi:hypothetical protein
MKGIISKEVVERMKRKESLEIELGGSRHASELHRKEK